MSLTTPAGYMGFIEPQYVPSFYFCELQLNLYSTVAALNLWINMGTNLKAAKEDSRISYWWGFIY